MWGRTERTGLVPGAARPVPLGEELSSPPRKAKGQISEQQCLFSSGAARHQDSRLLLPGLQLYWASRRKHLPEMAEALARGADVNWVNVEEDRATPLIQAVLGVRPSGLGSPLCLETRAEWRWGHGWIYRLGMGDSWLWPCVSASQGSLLTCEFLLQNGANVNLRDAQGRGPLHHATTLGHTGYVAREDLVDGGVLLKLVLPVYNPEGCLGCHTCRTGSWAVVVE